MHTHTDPHLEQLQVAVQLLREWADHCHNQAVVDDLFSDGAGNDDEDSGLPPLAPADRQAVYRYGYAVALDDAASLLDELLAVSADHDSEATMTDRRAPTSMRGS